MLGVACGERERGETMRRVAVVTMLVNLALGLLQPAAHAAVQCPPNPPSGSTVNGNLTVTAGQLCTLDNVTVTGSVTVSPGAELVMTGAHVLGNVTATRAAAVYASTSAANATRVDGNLSLDAVDRASVCDIVIGGNLLAQNYPATPAAPELAPLPACPMPAGGFVPSTVMSLVFVNNHRFLQYSGATIRGNVQLMGNTAGGSVDNSSIAGSAQCSNSPAFGFSNNTVQGHSTCPG